MFLAEEVGKIKRIPEKEKRVDACRFACIIMGVGGRQIYTSYSGLGDLISLFFGRIFVAGDLQTCW